MERTTNLELSMLHGASVSEIRICEEDVHLLFHPDGSVGIHGNWELSDGTGSIVDRACPNAERDALRLHHLLGRTVVGSEVTAPRSFRLRFDNGFTLCASEYVSAYRSFSIYPDLDAKKDAAPAEPPAARSK